MRQREFRSGVWLAGMMLGALATTVHGQTPGGAGVRPTPPPEPAVRPVVSVPARLDRDRDQVDDRITSAVGSARAALSRHDAATTEAAAARAALDERIEVELIFDRQITQSQIDAFLKAGGEITKVFSHVSYGWTGTVARRDAVRLPGLMGSSLLGVLGKTRAVLHMDEAGQTGRVRPQVWDMDVSGQSSGPGRITIAILDTGVDGTHSDLAGRLAYWKDWTTDNHATAQDRGHHGSHVAGIATGTGASAGVNPATLSYMDLGNFSSSSGSFFPSPIHIPASVTSFNWTSGMRWKTGSGVQGRLGHLYANTAGTYSLIGTYTSGNSSPLSETNTVTNPNAGGTSRFSSYASKNSGGGTPDYAMVNTVGYAGVGDGYNALSGVAPGSAWAGLKVFQDNGGGSSLDIDEALDDLVAQRVTHDIKVANMSLGYDGAYTPTRDKTNTAALNGIVVCVSAGNSGADSSGVAGEVGDPGRAHYAITVASSSDINQLTDYSSHGFAAPGDASGGDQDMKPDLMAPGGSTGYQSNIMSVDSNSSDAWDTNGSNFTDAVADNYLNIQGTSMASPFTAGCAALVIDAMQQSGHTWNFSGGAALNDVLRVKQLLLMTATESNLAREAGPSGNPVLQRGAKDINEGYGMINPDAAVEALLSASFSGGAFTADGTLGPGRSDTRCWARRAEIVAGDTVEMTLSVPSVGDYDLYLYAAAPDAYGNPVILASSVNAGNGIDESITFPVTTSQTGYVLVKRVGGGSTSGAESWVLSGDLGGVDTTPPTVVTVSAQSERTMDVTFSEAMGAGVAMAANYSVSGPGAGTLAVNPAGVALVSGNMYRLTWNAPEEMLAGAVVTVTVAGVSDSAANSIGTPDSGSTSGIGVPPSLILNSTADDPTSSPVIPVTATLSEAAADFTADDVTVNNATLGNFSGSGTDYTLELTPTGQGTVSASVAPGGFSDAAGNIGVTTATLTRIFDSAGPGATLATAATDPTSGSPIAVTVTLSEASTNFTGTDISVSNASVQAFSGSGSDYTFNLLPSDQGAVTAAIGAGTFTDAVGNSNTASNILVRTFDSIPPAVALTTEASDPTSVPLITVNVALSENAVGFTAADVVAVNAGVQNFSGSGTDYTFELVPSAQGAVTVSVAAGAFTDGAGNGNTLSNELTRLYDSVSPTVTLDSVAPDPTNAFPINVTATLSETSVDFDVSDILTTNALLQNFAGAGMNYSFELLPLTQGEVWVSAAAEEGAFTDGAGNGGTSDILTRIYDSVGPVVSSVSGVDRSSVDITFFEANAMGADATDASLYSVTGDGAAGVTATPDSVILQSGHTYRLIWSAGSLLPGQPVTVTVVDGAPGVHDAAGNPMGIPASGSTVAVPAELSGFSVE